MEFTNDATGHVTKMTRVSAKASKSAAGKVWMSSWNFYAGSTMTAAPGATAFEIGPSYCSSSSPEITPNSTRLTSS